MTRTPTGAVLDRVPHLDPKSRGYAVRDYKATGTKTPRSYSWSCAPHFDQGREGACVGHGFAHDLAARPVVREATSPLAFEIYHEAQRIDPWPGEDYDGTSVLAGAKVYVSRGFATGYRWGFGLEDMILTLGYNGPVVFGVDVLTQMFYPDEMGFTEVAGQLEGGHCVLGKAIKLQWKTGTTTEQKTNPGWLDHLNLNTSYVTWHQSWGEDFGLGGDVKVRLSGMAELLSRQGEVCVPVGRR